MGIYLPNVRPSSRVDYVLVGMEPSQGKCCRPRECGFRKAMVQLQFSIDTYLMPWQ